MSNSENENLEDVSKGNKESMDAESIDSTSNKKTRFTKSKSISEVFKELDSEDDLSLDSVEASSESLDDDSEDISNLTAAEGSALDSLEESTLDYAEEPLAEESALDSVEEPLAEEDEIDEIIPIHNEYKDLDESEAFDTESIDEGDESSEVDSYIESIVNESDDFSSDELADSKENLDPIGGEDHLLADDVDEEDSIDGEDINQSIEEDEEELKVVKVNKKASSDGVVLNKDKESSKRNFEIVWDSSLIITILSFIVGIGILIMGILYFNSSSDRVVDNVLSGETAGLAVFLIIIGLIIIAFSILRFISSALIDQSSSMIDMFNSIRNIDYDDVSEDKISRDDFDSVFSDVLNKNKTSNFSNDDGEKGSVDKNSDLFEKDDKVSDEDIEALYSKSNVKSQNVPSSSKKQNAYDSTDDSQDVDSFDDSYIDEDFDDSGTGLDDFDDNSMIDDSASEGDNMPNLKDKYSKYSFDDDADEIEESKPQFKKSVDMSKFDNEDLSEEDLEVEKRRKREELEEKKRRIIQGTNFDNSLRK